MRAARDGATRSELTLCHLARFVSLWQASRGPLPAKSVTAPRKAAAPRSRIVAPPAPRRRAQTNKDKQRVGASTHTSHRTTSSLPQVQKVFLLDEDDDDEAPPARPLAADLANGHKPGSGAANLARLNGGNAAASSSNAATKGKRKAQPSPPPLQQQASSSSLSTSYDSTKKRRKDETKPAPNPISMQYEEAMRGKLPPHPASMQYDDAMRAQRERDAQLAANPISQQYEGAMRAQQQQQQQRHAAPGYAQAGGSGTNGDWSYHQQPLAGYPSSSSTANYRGGYPSGGASLMPPVANGHATANRQQIVESADQAQRRMVSQAWYLEDFMSSS